MISSASTTSPRATRTTPFTLTSVTAAASALSDLGIGSTPTTTTTINGNTVILKDETATPSGSYKARPAACSLLLARAAGQARGVGVSTGNFAGGLGYAAVRLNMKVDIFVPGTTPANKLANINQHTSVLVHVVGDTFDDARAAAQDYAKTNGLPFFEPYDSVEAMLGNATLGLELASFNPDLVVSAIGGGGLLSGTGLGLEAAGENPKLVAVGSDNAPAAVNTINSGHYAATPTSPGIAEAIRVAKPGVLTTAELIRLGARGVLVTDDEIEQAIAFLWCRSGIKAEGGGAAAVAALLAGKIKPSGITVAVISGGNIDSDKFKSVVTKHGGEFITANKEILL